MSSSSNHLTAAAKEQEKEKAQRVRDCLQNHPISLWELRELALSSGGLVNGTFPSFMNIDNFRLNKKLIPWRFHHKFTLIFFDIHTSIESKHPYDRLHGPYW
jgi:hypothetical protein